MSAERLSREQRVARISALVDTIRTADAEMRTLVDDQVDVAALRRGLPSLFMHEALQPNASETSLREIAHDLQCTLDAVPAHIALLDDQGVIIAVNEAWRRFASDNALSDHAFSIGTNYPDVCDRATGDCSEEARASAEGIRQVLRRETESFSLEYSCHSPDQRRWFRMMVTPVLDTRLGGAVITHVDMTERRLAEEAIRTSEARFRAIVENEPECVKLLAPDGRLLDINPAGLRLIEADEPGQVIGRSLIELIHPEDRERYLAFHHRVSLGEAGQEEFRSVGLKGTERRMDTHAVPLRDADGHVSSVLSVTRDVTARTRAEAAARSRARHHEALARIGVAATRHTSLEAVFEVTVRDVAWALEVEYCKILKLAPDGSCLHLVAGVGWQPGLVGVATVGVDRESQAGYTLLFEGPVFVDDLATEKRFSAPALLRQHDVRSGGSVALRLGRTPWGVLGAHTRRTRAFDQADDDFLQSVASVLTIVIERVAVQRTLVHSEGRLREAQRIAGLGSWELDLATDRLSWSGEVFSIFGIEPGAFPASYDGFLACVHPDDRERMQAAHRAVIAGHSSLDIEYRIVHPDGIARIVRARGETTRDAQGHPVVLAGTVLDITDLRHSQTQVDTANAVMREAQRIARLGSWDFDVGSGRLSWSEETCRLFGTTSDAFAGTLPAFVDFILPEDHQAFDRAHALVTPDAPYLEAEYRIRRPDGDVRWLYERGVVTFDEQGRETRRLGVVMDVTEQKSAAMRLAESEERYRALFEHMAAGFVLFEVVTDEQGTPIDLMIAAANSGFERAISKPLHDAVGRRLTDVLPGIEQDAADWIGVYGRVALSGEAIQVEQVSDHLGRYFLVTAFRPLPRQCAVTFVDVTERRQAEEALRESEQRFRTTFAAAATGIAITATDGRFLECNDAYCRMLGYSQNELQTMDFSSLTHPDDRERNLALLGELLSGERASFVIETRYVGKGGQTVWSRVSVSCWLDSSGRPAGIIGVAEDITELKAAEAEREELLRREQDARRQADAASRYYQSLFEAAPGAYLVLDAADYRITAVSEAYLRATKTAREQIQGRGMFDDFPDQVDEGATSPATALRASLDRVKTLGRSDVMSVQRFPIRRPPAEGGGWEERYWSPVNTPVPGPDGRVAFIIHRVEDVTEYINARQETTGANDALPSLESRAQQIEVDIVLRSQELKRANDELERGQALLRIAGRTAKLGGWRLDLAPERLVWSDETCVIHDRPPGYQPTLVDGLEYYLPQHRGDITGALQRCMSRGEPFEFDGELTTATGRRIWGRAIGEAILNQNGEIVGVQGAFQDVTAQKAVAAEVGRLGSLLTTTLESLSDAFFTLDRSWRFSYVNAQAEALLHRSRTELLGGNIWQIYPEAVELQFYSEYHRAVTERVPVAFDEFYPPLQAWLEVRAYPSDEGLAVYFRDVTGRRRHREALRESEERFRLLSKATNDAIWDWNLATNALWWNEGFETLFGFSRTEVESTIDSWTTRVHPDDRTHVVADVHAAIDGGATSWSGEYRFLRRDGSYAYVLDRGLVIRDDTNRAVRMIGGMTDLSERKAIEERLREQAALLDRAQDAIVVRDLEHRVTYWNKSAERLYGWSATEVTGRSVQDLLYADPAPLLAATAATVETGEWMGELQQKTKDGQVITIEGRWSLVRDDAGRPQSVLAINTDVTDRKRLEQQFLRVQRMESIGTLAGGIAHDLNNVLAPIMMSIELLQLQCNSDDAREILDTIRVSTERGAAMVSQVLSFARGMEGQRVRLQLKPLIDDLVKIVHDTFPKNIHVVTRVSPDLWMLEADPTQVHQVLLNLCVNARDAMPDGGTISIGAENMVIDEHYAAMNIEARVGPHVRLDVEDNGMGILPAVIHQIFDPFFTTKEVGKGTGLGLSTTMAIVKSHGGFIRVDSEPGMGARFRAYFPAHEHKGQTSMPVEQVLPRGRGETVLVVDDEASIRQIARQTLEAFGYRVHVASNGADAVALFAQRVGEIDIALVDMMMPVMDGPATIRALRQIDQGLPIIGASGMTAQGGQAQATAAGVSEFLPKPYSADTLLKALAKILRRE